MNTTKVSDLKANPDNPRTISDEKLAMLKKSLKRFGDLSGIVFNRKSGLLVGGHQRVKVLPPEAKVIYEFWLKKPSKTGTLAEGHVLLEGERFKYREVSWDETTERAANIAANQHGGEWEMAKLTEWVKGLRAGGFDMETVGFTQAELEARFGEAKKEVPGCDEDEVPTPRPRAEVKAKLGHIWSLGRHRLMCGDSTKREDLARLMDGEKADLWLTDPPYGVSYQAKNAAVNGGIVKNQSGQDGIASDEASLEELSELWAVVAGNALIACSAKASYYWFACQGGDQMMMMMMSISRAGWKVRHELIWVKDSMVFGRSDYHYKHEPILYGWKQDGTHQWNSDRKQTSVLEFKRPKKSDEHPTMKPVELVEYLMGNNTKPGQIVLDTFGGSGTTLIAAEKSGRSSRLIEISPKYCDVIVARWEKYTGQKAKLVNR